MVYKICCRLFPWGYDIESGMYMHCPGKDCILYDECKERYALELVPMKGALAALKEFEARGGLGAPEDQFHPKDDPLNNVNKNLKKKGKIGSLPL